MNDQSATLVSRLRLATEVFQLPNAVSLQIFPTSEKFLRIIRKRFLSREPWERKFGVKFLAKIRKKFETGDVFTSEELQEFYQQTVDLVLKNMQFAESLPLFLRVQQAMLFDQRPMAVLYLLGRDGFRIVAYAGIIRTIFYASGDKNCSYYTLFNDGWRAIRVRGLLLRHQNHGDKLERPKCEWHSPSNWSRCPNPHARVRGAKQPRIPDLQRQWLDELGSGFDSRT